MPAKLSIDQLAIEPPKKVQLTSVQSPCPAKILGIKSASGILLTILKGSRPQLKNSGGYHCNQLWREARPLVQSGQLQLRHIMVAVLRPSSEGKAAAILKAPSPEKALASHAQAYANAHGKDPDSLGIAALTRIPLSARDALANNLSLMTAMGIRATPATIWKNAQGLVQTRTGMPPGLLESVMEKTGSK